MSLVLNVEILGEFRNLAAATKGAQSELSTMNAKASSVSSSIKRALTSIGVGLSFAMITRELNDMAKAATEDAKSQALLANQLKNTTGATDEQIVAVEKQISTLQLSASVADDKLRPAFAQLTRATGDTATAMDLLKLATDVSAGSGKSLESVTMALTKAYGGKMAALTKLGIPMSDSIQNASDYAKEMTKLNQLQSDAANTVGPAHTKAMEKVAEQQEKVNRIAAAGIDWQGDLAAAFANSAETAANIDPYQQLQIAMGEIEESIGAILLPVIKDLSGWLLKMAPEIQTFFRELGDPTTPLGKAWNGLGAAFTSVMVALKNTFASGKSDAEAFITVLNVLKGTLEAVAALINLVSGKTAGDWGYQVGVNARNIFTGTNNTPTPTPVKVPVATPGSFGAGSFSNTTNNTTVVVSTPVTAKTIVSTVSQFQKSTGTTLAQALK